MGYILLLVWAVRLLVEGHKEPVAATIANNEDGDDDDIYIMVKCLYVCNVFAYSIFSLF